jgi:hypothetical protein
LLDTDKAGGEAHDHLVKAWLTRYKDNKAMVLSLGPTVGRPTTEFAIEDLFPDDYYVKFVEEAYRKELQLAGSGKLSITGTDQVCKRTERALEQAGISFNKGRVAKLIRRDLSRSKSIKDIPKETADMGRLLIAAVTKALSELHS